jgi:hypothetical protein
MIPSFLIRLNSPGNSLQLSDQRALKSVKKEGCEPVVYETERLPPPVYLRALEEQLTMIGHPSRVAAKR